MIWKCENKEEICSYIINEILILFSLNKQFKHVENSKENNKINEHLIYLNKILKIIICQKMKMNEKIVNSNYSFDEMKLKNIIKLNMKMIMKL